VNTCSFKILIGPILEVMLGFARYVLMQFPIVYLSSHGTNVGGSSSNILNAFCHSNLTQSPHTQNNCAGGEWL